MKKEVIQSPCSALGEEAICASLLPDYCIVSAAPAVTRVREKTGTEMIMQDPGYLPGRGSRRAVTATLSSGLQPPRQEARTAWEGFAFSSVVLPNMST